MGYYMRFITTDKVLSDIPRMNGELKKLNPQWDLDREADAKRPSALLKFGSELYGEFEVNVPGDGLFGEEIGELLEFIQAGENREPIQSVLKEATAIYALRVLWQGRDYGDTLDQIQPLWERLFDLHSGLLQVDDDGYYDKEERIFALG